MWVIILEYVFVVVSEIYALENEPLCLCFEIVKR